MSSRGIVLLSGGLDSLVSLGLGIKDYGVSLALTFDYGQKSARYEIDASKEICDYYKIEHKVINLDWLKNITHTSLVSSNEIPEGKELEDSVQSAKSVWVPNRNGLFLNIAGCFADSENSQAVDTIKTCLLEDEDEEVKKNALIALYNLVGREILDEVANGSNYPDALKLEAVSMISEYEEDEENSEDE